MKSEECWTGASGRFISAASGGMWGPGLVAALSPAVEFLASYSLLVAVALLSYMPHGPDPAFFMG